MVSYQARTDLLHAHAGHLHRAAHVHRAPLRRRVEIHRGRKRRAGESVRRLRVHQPAQVMRLPPRPLLQQAVPGGGVAEA